MKEAREDDHRGHFSKGVTAMDLPADLNVNSGVSCKQEKVGG